MMLLKRIRVFIGIVLLALLSGCVTTTDSALTKNADPELALQRFIDLGFEYIKREDFSRAQKHLVRALEIDEDNARANSAMGLIYQRQGEKKLAEESFQSAIDNDPRYTQGRTYYAAFLFSNQRYNDSLEQFLKAAEDTTYSARSQVYTNIALCNVRLNKPERALQAYERALQIDRFNSGALAGMTEVLLSLNNFKQAQYYYNRLVQQIANQSLSHSARTLWQGVRIARHFNASQQEASLAALLKELYPDSPEYKRYLSQFGGK